jgi:wyosine [tRNA(Phe)-imidazoG37] synthetase (radical SAM superfamily)
MDEPEKHLYGPIASRRLGLSLGVDVVPLKVCPLDCLYCQLGKTPDKSTERGQYVSAEQVLTQLTSRLQQGLEADFITVGGSGEPTLNSDLGKIIDGIKHVTDIPVAILTNGALFYRPEVRADCIKADVVLPSLDAGDEQTFRRINRPHDALNLDKLVAGLSAFRAEFPGKIWIEVFLIEGLNTADEQIAQIQHAIGRIGPDKIQLNTAVRPTAERGIRRVETERLQQIALQLGPTAEVIADFPSRHDLKSTANGTEPLLSMLKRRPCSLNDVCSALGISAGDALKCLNDLRGQGMVDVTSQDGTTFFKAL